MRCRVQGVLCKVWNVRCGVLGAGAGCKCKVWGEKCVGAGCEVQDLRCGV